MRIRIVDAFTDRVFAGNPAGVCVLDGDWPDEAWMQQLAGELHLPRTERRLCGHATLATAFVLHADGVAGTTMRFHTLGGVLLAGVADNGTVTLDFPAATVTARDAIDGLADALGAAPLELHATGSLRGALAEVTRREDIRSVTATAPAAPGAGHDFVSRFFSPADGAPEDPVTGSAHCALAPFWSQRLGGTRHIGHQLSERGGVVQTELAGDRVLLRGRAVIVLDGAVSSAARA